MPGLVRINPEDSIRFEILVHSLEDDKELDDAKITVYSYNGNFNLNCE